MNKFQPLFQSLSLYHTAQECSLSTSHMHKSALAREQEHLAAEQGGGIAHVFSAVASVDRKAAVRAMKCLYWMAKNEIAHTTKYAPLLELARSLEYTYFDNLHVGGNVTYTIEWIWSGVHLLHG